MIYMFLQKKEKAKKNKEYERAKFEEIEKRLAEINKKLDALTDCIKTYKDSRVNALDDDVQSKMRTVSDAVLDAAKNDRARFDDLVNEWLNGEEGATNGKER